MSHAYRRTFRYAARVCRAVSVLGCVAFTAAQAQDPTVRMDSMRAAMAAKLVRIVGPKEIVFDPGSRTVKVRLFNPTADTAAVEVSLRFAPPGNLKPLVADALLLNEDSVVTDSVLRDSLRTDSLEKLWSLASWILEPLPTQIWIAPHQTVALTLHLREPSAVPPGEYSAHLIVSTMHVQDLPPMQINFGGDGVSSGGVATMRWKFIMALPEGISPRASVKMLYKVGRTVE